MLKMQNVCLSQPMSFIDLGPEIYYFRVQGNIIPVVNSRGVKRRSTDTPDISPAKQIKKEPEPVPMVNYLIEKYVP